jgi:MFS family permease
MALVLHSGNASLPMALGRPAQSAIGMPVLEDASMDGVVSESSASAAQVSRPTVPLSLAQLVQISVFWFATNAMWGGWEIFQQERGIQFFGSAQAAGLPLGMMELIGMPIAALGTPIAGSLSDYTTTHWGRRKPYVLVGAIVTFFALAAVAFAPTFELLVLFFIAFLVGTAISRGPFAGLVPDIVPERQVGTASGLMGLMIVLGLIGGTVIMSAGYALGSFSLPTLALGLLMLVTALATVAWVPKGPPGNDRQSRSWPRIALETFGTDLLRERDYLFLLGSRFCILMALAFFMNLNILYLEATFNLSEDERGPWVVAALVVTAIVTALSTIPSARISDRIGRKPVIYFAAAIGATGTTIIGLTDSLPVLIAGVALLAVGSGAFLAVDWALMTEVIPRSASGRYMGLSNIVEATNGPVATAAGGLVLATVGAMTTAAIGGRAAILLGLVLFGAGVVLLHPVHERHRRGRPTELMPAAG